jgi:hypothetical protein
MEPDEETWVEGAYKAITLTNGSGVKYFTFDAPWMPDPQKEYVMCLELTERGPSFVSTDFQTKGYSQLPAWAKYWVMDQSNGSTHIKSSTGVWAWDSTSIPTSAIRGYPAHGIYAEIAAEELAEAPTTFQTLINARARDIASGEYSDIDPATQIVRAEVSLDGGSHWTPLAPGEDLSTLYTGTDLIFRLLAGNNNAKEIVIPSLGFSYEV